MPKKLFKVIPFADRAYAGSQVFPAKTSIPEWYKKSPQKLEDSSALNPMDPASTNSTYKHYSPFLDAMTSGYTVALAVDVEVIETGHKAPSIVWRTTDAAITTHASAQWEGMPAPDGYVPLVYKWQQDFGIELPEGFSALFTHPLNRHDLPFVTLAGVVDVDSYHIPVHFPFFLKEGFTGIIEKGTPVCQILPFKRDAWALEREEYSRKKDEELHYNFFSKIVRAYKNHYWHRKDYS